MPSSEPDRHVSAGIVNLLKSWHTEFHEVRQFFRIHTTMKQPVSLRQQREIFRQRLVALQALVKVA